MKELQTELVKLANSKAEYDKVGDEIYRLRDEKQKVADLEGQLKAAKVSAKEEADKAIAEEQKKLADLQEQLEIAKTSAKRKPTGQSPKNRKKLPICRSS